MTRRSSGGTPPGESGTVAVVGLPARLARDGFQPTEDMRLARARLQIELNDMVSLTGEMSLPQAAQLLGEPRLESWAKANPDFRRWLFAKRDDDVRVQALFDHWLDEMGLRLPGMSDKDAINTGKLLAEIAAKIPDKSSRAKYLDEGIANLSDEQLAALVNREAAKQQKVK